MPSMKELLTRINWSLSSLQAKIDLVDFDNSGVDRTAKPLMIVEVISDRFKDMAVFQRTLVVDDMLSRKDPTLYKSLELAYECYTHDEYALGFMRKVELH